MNRVMNSVGNNFEGTLRHDPGNPAYLHPSELAELGITPGDRVQISSDHGSIEAIAQEDRELRAGVVSIAHCWGGLPGGEGAGANTNLLIADDRDLASVNMMPRMSAIPVTVRPAG